MSKAMIGALVDHFLHLIGICCVLMFEGGLTTIIGLFCWAISMALAIIQRLNQEEIKKWMK